MAFDNFMTPPDELAIAREYLGGITLDPASSLIAAPYVQATRFAISSEEANQAFLTNTHIPYNTFIDGLKLKWQGRIWLNPPYSKGLIDAYVDKAITEWDRGYIERMLILVNSATDTKWFHKLTCNSTRLLHYKGRIKFWKMFNGAAHATWEGEVSIKRRTEDPTVKAKVGNQPRFLNTLFLFERDTARLPLFKLLYGQRGTILQVDNK